MKIKLIEVGLAGESGERYIYEAELDVSSEDEAYVKGREFEKLTGAIARGTTDQWRDHVAARQREVEEQEKKDDADS